MMMKKILLILAAALLFGAAAAAQPRALGIRAGWGAEVDYEHALGDAYFLEGSLGLGSFQNSFVSLSGLFNFVLARPDWTPRGDWSVYAGPGVGAIFARDFGAGGILGDIGLEYRFWFPLQLSLDLRPALMIGSEGIVTQGIFNFGLGIRYAF